MEENTNISLIINPGSGTAIYRQIVSQVNRQVLSGILKEGDLLPSVRWVASEYGVNPMTVSKAYNLLEERSVLERVRGVGMKVRIRDEEDNNNEKIQLIIPILSELKLAARQLNISKKQIKSEIDKFWEKEDE